MQADRRHAGKAEANLDHLKNTISELVIKHPDRALEYMVQLEMVAVLTSNTTAIINLSHHIFKHDEEWQAHIAADNARENQLKGAKPIMFWIAKGAQVIVIAVASFAYSEISQINDTLTATKSKIELLATEIRSHIDAEHLLPYKK